MCMIHLQRSTICKKEQESYWVAVRLQYYANDSEIFSVLRRGNFANLMLKWNSL